MGKRELASLFSLSSWCLVIVVWLFLAVPWICLLFVIVVLPDHTHLLFLAELVLVQADPQLILWLYMMSTRIVCCDTSFFIFI